MFSKFFSIIITLIFSLIMPLYLIAQEKGSFDKEIQFNSENRKLSLYVPTDFSPDSTYKLIICLHGMGDNSINYRNALITYLKWNSFMPNTIFICPDGGSDQGKDFYYPEGDEEIITEVLKYAKENYKIDATKIILQGFSLGGRSALKYGLEHPENFKGLLLNTPAVQGTKDADNIEGSSLMFKYESASKIPVAIIHGQEDFTYLGFIPRMYDSLVSNNGISMREVVPGLGHSIPGTSYMQRCYGFIMQPVKSEFDIEFYKINETYRACNPNQKLSCGIRNLGSAVVNSVDFKIEYEGSETTYKWAGKLDSFEYIEFEMPEITFAKERNDVKVTITAINNEKTDLDTANNHKQTHVMIQEKGLAGPVYTTFEADDKTLDYWFINQSGSIFTWSPDENTLPGSNIISMFNMPLLFDNQGTREDLVSPVIDLSTINNPEVSFDLAFNYLLYTPPYVNTNTAFSDTLVIAISADCGETYQPLYKKAGKELATADNPITNALSVEACIFEPKSGEWRKEVIDLTPYKDLKSALFKFSIISGLGGTIYLDNIRFDIAGTFEVDENYAGAEISISPNPTSDFVYIYTQKRIENINIFDINGKNLLSAPAYDNQQNIRIDVSSLEIGTYFIEIQSGVNKAHKMLIISR